jgi:hypothetical protein
MEIKIAREQFTFCHFESDAHTKKEHSERQEERKREREFDVFVMEGV